MEKDFQTSFIPKQSVVPERTVAPRGINIFTIVGVVVFLTTIAASGGLLIYKGLTERSITKMASDLDIAKNRFEPSKIVQLEVLNKRLNAATEILGKHVAISPIFEELGKITMKTVRFRDFEYSLSSEPSPKIFVRMTGEGVGYRSIALQSDLFSQDKYFIDPVFSDLSLDSKGNVGFQLEFAVEPTFVDYQEKLKVSEN